jgi:peptidoglycan hydrolase-like protein with peptidoglycan-binding domain
LTNKRIYGYGRPKYDAEPKKTTTTTETKKPTTKPVEKTNVVKEWQKAAVKDGYKFPKYGTDGEWGSECESVAKKAICKKQVIGYKNKNLTKVVQKAVGVKVDGKFGKNTKTAVIEWQKLMKITADGVVGYNTWKKLLGV